jgi:hypothetical protein
MNLFKNRKLPLTHAALVQIPVFAMLVCAIMAFLSCGSVTPMTPTGIAAWADDCSAMACAINKYDWDGRIAMDHETNQRCDLALFDEKGNRTQTLYSDRKSGGYESKIEDLYFMKSRGYLLTQTMRYNCGGKVFEKIGLDGKTVTLFQQSCDSLIDDVSMIPSPQGTYIALVSFKWNSSKPYNARITFFDSTGNIEIKKMEPFDVSYSPSARWLSDSIMAVFNPYGGGEGPITVLGPFMDRRDTTGQICEYPRTSSDSYCKEKGYVSFDGNTQTVKIVPTAPAYQNRCVQ